MEHRNMESLETIPQFFSGKDIFITGGSGFMGKVLIEKLLRTCPDGGNIYLLIRPKSGVDINTRISNITDNMLFDTVKANGKNSLKRLIAIEGNIKEIDLGLSAENMSLLMNNVSIIYHVAATVRFNSPLTQAIIMNTRSTREVCKLALKLKNPAILVHFSTAYCQPENTIIEEKLYPPYSNWREMINIVETMDESLLNLIAPKYTAGFPNTYTFSKSLAENVVADMCGGNIPTVLVRPTIVMPTFQEPIAGWVDNLNGPIGGSVATSKGLSRSTFCSNMDAKMDYIPVDISIDRVIIATWVERNNYEEVAVYNSSNSKVLFMSQREFLVVGKEVLKAVPTISYWSPVIHHESNIYLHLIYVYLFQILPALFVDMILWMRNKPPQLFKIQKTLHTVLLSLDYFMSNEWYFVNEKFMNLEDFLLPEDKKMFGIDTDNMDRLDYFTSSAKTSFQIIFDEDEKYYRFYRILSNILWVVHHLLRTTTVIYLGSLIFKSLVIPGFNRYCQYVNDL